jgi:transcriptional regulator with XRE-family HTH domain
MSTNQNRNQKELLSHLERLTKESFSFATILKGFRTREDMTQEQLALKLGVTKSYISDLENKRRYVTVTQAKSFAKKLKEPVEVWVTTSLQDMVTRAGLTGTVKIVA